MALSASPVSAFVDGRAIDPLWGSRPLDLAVDAKVALAPDAPLQTDLDGEFSFERDGYLVELVQGFGIEALVLSRRDYGDAGDLGALVPTDLALAWGDVSTPGWARHLRVTQGERLYRWSFPPGVGMDQGTVEISSANMHIMPATEAISGQIASLGRGDVVRITGFLVDISRTDADFSWKTSRTREDVGRGACEIILVTGVEIEGR